MGEISDKNIIARKNHKCCFCGLSIKKGDAYIIQNRSDNMDDRYCKSHPHCIKLIDKLHIYDAMGYTRPELFEFYIDRTYKSWIPKDDQTACFEDRLTLVRQMYNI